MTVDEAQEGLLIKISEGIITIDELYQLAKIYSNKYKVSGKDLSACIDYQCFNELLRRLKTSVFSDIGKNYPEGYKSYCIQAEYHNTKLFIETTKKLITIAHEHGDITQPEFYGQPDPGYKISYEAIIHIIVRHNESINSFINKDSVQNEHKPSSFGFGAIALSILTMLMALNILKEGDWRKADNGKNLICHFIVADQVYTLIRKGKSNEILSFYPRNDSSETNPIQLKRDPEQMRFMKENE